MDYNKMTYRRQRLFELLCSGRNSVADICRKTGYSDPRGHIRALRNAGVKILDEWRKTADGVRYKVYWIASYE